MLLNGRLLGGGFRVKNGEEQAGAKEDRTEVNREFLEDVGGLGSEQVLRHAAAEGSAEALVFRTLHQDDQDHEHGSDDQNAEKQVNGDV